MKKTTLLLILLIASYGLTAQVLNQPANWPNTNWSVTGTFTATSLEADPSVDANFSFNDDTSGSGVDDDIAAESPVIDITAAFTAGEFWIEVDIDHVLNGFDVETLGLQYWDADGAQWLDWSTPTTADTTGAPFNNFCGATFEPLIQGVLNISSFTATQQSGFRYRIAYDDNGTWGWGFCVNSPTITSQTPPSCPDPTTITVTNVTDSTADISWIETGSATNWTIEYGPSGFTLGTGTTVNATTIPFTLTGLSSSTNFDIYVQSNCGGTSGDSNFVSALGLFTTLNTPPPPPVGVTCSSGGSTFIFTEDFNDDPPVGWTGNSFNGANGNWDITGVAGNSFGTGPDVTYDGNPGTHLEYEASGNSSTIASAISPGIDLSTAVDGAELSFFFHAFGDDIGTLNVNVIPQSTGVPVNVFTWVGDLQLTAGEAWVPVGIDISAYLGEVINVEFSYGGTGNGFEGDMSIDFVRVETCGSFCVAPSSLVASNVTFDQGEISWVENNAGVTSWDIEYGPAGFTPGTGTTVAGVTTNPFTITGLSPTTTYDVYIYSLCSPTTTSIGGGPLTFTTPQQFNYTLDCTSGGPVTVDYCYDNNAAGDVFTFTSNDGTPLNLVFNTGNVEVNFDEIVVLDTGGTPFPGFAIADQNYGNNGDMSGLTFQSTGDTISFFINSDGSVSCQSGSFGLTNGINFTVSCATCVNPQATYTVVDDCANGNQFLVDVDITDLGDATSVTISNDFDATTVPNITATGVQQIGPFPLGTNVQVTVSHDQDVNCVINSQVLTLDNCPPPAPVGVTCSSGGSTFIFTEEFNDDPPVGWTGNSFNGANGNWDITGPAGNSFGTGPDVTYDGNPGTHLEYEASGNSTNIASAISPAIDLTTAVDGAELSFYMHAFGDDIGTLNVNVIPQSTGVPVNVYTWVGDYQTSETEAWVPVGIDISAYLGEVINVEFSYGGTGTGFEGDMSIDFVRVETCGNFCVAPSSINLVSFTDTTLEFSWIENNGGVTSWNIEYGPTGFTPGTGTLISGVTNNPFTITGLSSSTSYDIYIQSICSPTFNSIFGGPATFTTDNTPPPPPVGVNCTTANSAFIYTAEFDTVDGWTGDIGTNSGQWSIPGLSPTFGTGPNSAFSGNNFMNYEASGAFGTASVVSPAIDLGPAVDSAELSFYFHAFGPDMGTLNVGVGTSPSGPFVNVFTWIGDLQTAASDPWVPVGINLDAYLGQVIYVEFTHGGVSGIQGDMSIDFVRVQTCGTFCIAPSSVNVINIGDTSAQVSWIENNGGVNSWNIEYGPAGFTPGSGTLINGVTSNPYNITGLNPLTSYDVYIQSICDPSTGFLSINAGPSNFTTRDILPPPPIPVACNSATTYALIDEFDDDNGGWTGDFGNNIGLWELPNGLSSGLNTGAGAPFSGSDFMNYEGSAGPTGATQTASAVSPAVDLTTSGAAVMSFYYHAYGADMGTLNVNIGTSPTGPWNTEFTVTGQQQTSQNAAWTPVGIDLATYVGQVIYLEFSHTGTGTGPLGDICIDLVRVETCDCVNFDAEIESQEVFIDATNGVDDLDIVNPVCGFNSVTLDINNNFADAYQWYQDGFPISGATGSTYLVTQSGEYQVQAFDVDCATDDFSQPVQITMYDESPPVSSGTLELCDNDVDGSESFDLDGYTASLGLPTGFTVTYYTNTSDANQAMNSLSSPYASSGEQLVVRIEDTDAFNDGFLGCRQISQLDLLLNSAPVISQPMDIEACVTGTGVFDLTSVESELVTDTTGLTITYHTSQPDADTGSNAIGDPANYTSSATTIYVRVENGDGCYSTTSFDLAPAIQPLASVDPQYVLEVCPQAQTDSAYEITIGITADNFTLSEVDIEWYDPSGNLISGATGLTYDGVDQQGTYEVVITYNQGLMCSDSVFIDVDTINCVIPQGISPSLVDGLNDTLDLTPFRVSNIQIFNRNGSKVYEKNNYTDEWDGRSSGGDVLPVGTYFFTMVYLDGRTYTGWVYINRE